MRNAGFLMTGTAFSYAESVRKWGRAEARRLEALSWQNREHLAKMILSRFDSGATRSGTWRLAESELEEDELRESHSMLEEDGFPYRWLHRSEASALGRRFHGGLEQEGDFAVHPAKLLRAIAEDSGQLRRRAAVASLERTEERGVRLQLGDGTLLAAARAVVTLNGYAGSLLGEAPVRPVRAQVLLTRPLERRVWTRPVYSHYGYFYFRQLEQGHLLVGGARHLFEKEEIGTSDETSPDLQRELESFLHSIVPDAPPVELRWSGVMGFTRDSRPRIERIGGDPRTMLLAGFNGHGVGLAFECARLLVESEFRREGTWD